MSSWGHQTIPKIFIFTFTRFMVTKFGRVFTLRRKFMQTLKLLLLFIDVLLYDYLWFNLKCNLLLLFLPRTQTEYHKRISICHWNLTSIVAHNFFALTFLNHITQSIHLIWSVYQKRILIQTFYLWQQFGISRI